MHFQTGYPLLARVEAVPQAKVRLEDRLVYHRGVKEVIGPWLVIFLAAWVLSTSAEASFRRAKIQLAPGETSSMYLAPAGLYWHPHYNDVFGDTDKHLTGATKFGWLVDSGPGSWETVASWRLFMPAFAGRTGLRPYDEPVGRFADSLELKTAWARSFEVSDFWRFKFQTALGLHHLGNKGGQHFHRWFHYATNNPVTPLDYDDQPESITGTTGVAVATYFVPVSMGPIAWSAEVLVGFEDSTLMAESFLEHTWLIQVARLGLDTALSARWVLQHYSEVFENVRSTRWEAALGVRWRWYRPSVKVMSPFLVGDDYGQMFVDIINLHFVW